MNLSLKKYITVELALTTMLIASLWFPIPLIGHSVITVIFFIFTAYPFGTSFFPDQKKSITLGVGLLVTISLLLTFLTITYYPFGYSPLLLSIAILLLAGKATAITRRNPPPSFSYTLPHVSFPLLFTIVASLGELALLLFIFSRRFTDTLISPWTLFGPRFWIGAFLITVFTIATLLYEKAPGRPFLLTLFLGRITSVAALIFVYGFGFDPFIHEAAMKTILATGEILPKTPYYIGEYMLAIPLHVLTTFSLSSIHHLLVPILFAFGVPLLLLATNNKPRFSVIAVTCLTLWPLSFFTQTTPNNLALVFALFAIIVASQIDGQKKHWLALVGLFLLASTAIHPFIGVPALCGVGALIAHRSGKKILVLLALFASLLITPLMLIGNGLLAHTLPVLTNIVKNPAPLLSLVKLPYWWLFPNAPLSWQVFYYYRFLLPYALLAALCFGVWRYKFTKIPVYVAGALTLSGVFLTMLTMPGVIGYEQGVYASRLLTLALVFLFPLAFHTIERIEISLLTTRAKKIGVVLILAPLVCISWYFTYPTRDAVSKHTGYSVRAADIEAVHFIQERNGTSTDYIVLTNQTVSAAAIREFGFVRYHTGTDGGQHYLYSVPTGGPLYGWFRHMVYNEPKRQWMIEAMEFAGVKKAYFVHTNYWYPAAQLRDEAKKEADVFFDIGQGRVWVYEYTLAE